MGKMKASYALWDLAQKGGIIALHCEKCRHNGFVTAQTMLKRSGTRLIGLMPFKCSRCSGRNIRRRAFIPA